MNKHQIKLPLSLLFLSTALFATNERTVSFMAGAAYCKRPAYNDFYVRIFLHRLSDSSTGSTQQIRVRWDDISLTYKDDVSKSDTTETIPFTPNFIDLSAKGRHDFIIKPTKGTFGCNSDLTVHGTITVEGNEGAIIAGGAIVGAIAPAQSGSKIDAFQVSFPINNGRPF